jgi:hypothetical protein
MHTSDREVSVVRAMLLLAPQPDQIAVAIHARALALVRRWAVR